MDYLHKYNINKGFTLLEVLVVLAIFAILFAVSDGVYINFKRANNLSITTNTIVEAVRYASSNASSNRGDSKWGVKINNNEILIFKGDSYESRDTSFNESFKITGGIIVSGLSEVIFEKLSGATLSPGTIILSSYGEVENININEKGTITY
ncbi:MAG: prepilin-type N-terminal cleavage/methylation domain-containing protein [Candidatus Paceibacterota bacterium]